MISCLLLSGAVLRPVSRDLRARSRPTSKALNHRRAAIRAEIEAMAARIELQLLAAIMGAPASSLPPNSYDSIFALIEADRQANAERRSRNAEDAIARTLFTTEPTTVAGVAALMTYVVELTERGDGRPDVRNDDRTLLWSLPLHRTVTRALAKMAVACAGAAPTCGGS